MHPMLTASIFSNFWGNLEEHHEQAVFLVLVGFIGSFAFIRMSTRIIRSESVSWWPGNIESEPASTSTISSSGS